jgi:hypothetical protein
VAGTDVEVGLGKRTRHPLPDPESTSLALVVSVIAGETGCGERSFFSVGSWIQQDQGDQEHGNSRHNDQDRRGREWAAGRSAPGQVG